MTERRMFRGRGGPTDGRLPKHNARRRKNHKSGDQELSIDSGDPFAAANFITAGGAPEVSDRLCQDNDALQVSKFAKVTIKNDGLNDAVDVAVDEYAGSDGTGESDPIQSNELTLQKADVEWKSFFSETNHLRTRIRRCREIFQQATTSLAIPSNYETHVLRAVLNCVSEWRAILKHFAHILDQANVDDVAKSIGMALFDLIQHALQCGPLSGSKAGYWKRSGSDVALMGHAFLIIIAPTMEDARLLYLTDRQVDNLMKWKSGAQKAIGRKKFPSKSNLSNCIKAERARAEAHLTNEVKKQRRLDGCT